MNAVKTTLLLMALQVVVGGLTYFVYSIRWLALLGGVALLAGIWQIAGARLRGRSRTEAWVVAVLFQLPGLIGSVNVAAQQLGLWKQNTLGDTLDFVMETWHTALLPWATLLPNRLIHTASGENLVLFFLALPFMSPLLAVWTVMAGRNHRIKRGGDRS